MWTNGTQGESLIHTHTQNENTCRFPKAKRQFIDVNLLMWKGAETDTYKDTHTSRAYGWVHPRTLLSSINTATVHLLARQLGRSEPRSQGSVVTSSTSDKSLDVKKSGSKAARRYRKKSSNLNVIVVIFFFFSRSLVSVATEMPLNLFIYLFI